jgi:hypothetical protein
MIQLALFSAMAVISVYSNKNNDDAVVKVSRYGAKTELVREAGVLKVLKNSMADYQRLSVY